MKPQGFFEEAMMGFLFLTLAVFFIPLAPILALGWFVYKGAEMFAKKFEDKS